MKSRPILMSAPMVLALLEGRKTQTRRVVKGAEQFPEIIRFEPWAIDEEVQRRESGIPLWFSREPDGTCREWGCNHGGPGDRLWVRETFNRSSVAHDGGIYRAVLYCADGAKIIFHSDQVLSLPSMRDRIPSIHMPRWASRIELEICAVTVQRLQDITEADILAEGVTVDRVAEWCKFPWSDMPTLHHAFEVLWDHLHGLGAWKANPWVWKIEFRAVESPGS